MDFYREFCEIPRFEGPRGIVMFAIFESLGRQYKVSVGDRIRVDHIPESPEAGTQVVFNQVLMVSEADSSKLGKPFLEGASVTAEFLNEGKEKKQIAFKKKRRKGFHKKIGFRRKYSELIIRNISAA